VKSAYTSQACSVCYYVDKLNRPDQQTFCCLACGYSIHADLNAALNIQRRLAVEELWACKDRRAIKALLMQRHAAWRTVQGWP
jgi:transposase